MKKIIYFLFLILFSSFVYSIGTCSLDKQDYLYGEIAIFTCQCTYSGEQNTDGYIVFKKSDDTILSSVAINSGNCMITPFVSTYFFIPPTGYEGNATFAKNPDGTGSPGTYWGHSTDIIHDGFNLTLASPTDCYIQFENNTGSYYDLGNYGAGQFQVIDPITNFTISKAYCSLHIMDLSTDNTLLSIPLTGNGDISTNIYSSGLGKIYFQHKMNENFWEIDTNYKMNVNCFANVDDYILGNGTHYLNGTYFKECESNFIFFTGEDNRLSNRETLLPLVICLIVFIIYLAAVGYLNFRMIRKKGDMNFWIFVVCTFLSVVELVFMYGVVYLAEKTGIIENLIGINFLVVIMISFGLSMVTLFSLSFRLLTFDSPDKKW